MFTPASRRRIRLSWTALAAAGVAYAATYVLLTSLAVWAEASEDAYPYLPGEEPIRYLLPSFAASDPAQTILVVGPSAANEAVLYHRLQEALPGWRAVQGALSAATLDEILVALEYWERVHGRLPAVLVAGMTVRTLANLPRSFGPRGEPGGYSPLFATIDRYSAHFTVEPRVDGSRLVPKGTWRSIRSRVDFLLKKQQPRWRAAVATVFDRAINGRAFPLQACFELPQASDYPGIRNPLSPQAAPLLAGFAWERGLFRLIRAWLPAYRSPYSTHFAQPIGPDLSENALAKARHWNPADESDLLLAQLRRLRRIAQRNGSRLVVVMLPENPESVRRYPPSYEVALGRILTEGLAGTPFLDLRRLLPAGEFFDEIHPSPAGAEEVTDRIIRFIKPETRNQS